MTEERLKKINEVASKRQGNLTVVLNNVHDPHNIGAVLRTCDSVGIKEIYVIYNDDRVGKDNIALGKNSASSARKWVDVYLYRDVDKCICDIRKKYDLILGTHLDSESVSLYDLQLNKSIALVFGNENAGISDEVLKHLDGNFLIPQVGMVQSLNISVSVAVTLYEALRQREKEDLFVNNTTTTQLEKQALIDDYIQRHVNRHRGRKMKEI